MSVLFVGRKQEEHHRGGVVGKIQTAAVLLARHDQERLRVLHLGLPEDQPAFWCECDQCQFCWWKNFPHSYRQRPPFFFSD